MGEKCDAPRPLEDGEVGEWILLEGVCVYPYRAVSVTYSYFWGVKQTPATCTNIGLHNLYPDEIDLVVSGPNFGTNTGGECLESVP